LNAPDFNVILAVYCCFFLIWIFRFYFVSFLLVVFFVFVAVGGIVVVLQEII
jgi:hypothetical protein